MSNEDKQPNANNPKDAPSFSTTHDLRKHAEEALRLLRDAQQRAADHETAQKARQDASNSSDDSSPNTQADTDDSFDDSLYGNTTQDLAREAAEALRMMHENSQAADKAALDTLIQQSNAPEQDNDPEQTEGITPYVASATVDEAAAEQQATTNGNSDVTFSEHMVLRIDVTDSGEPLIIDVRGEMIVGRGDTVTSYTPDVDLTPHGAYRLGLSRKHAILQREDDTLQVIDMGSRNGTHINGSLIEPKTPHSVQSGDEVQFGNLTVRFFFQARA